MVNRFIETRFIIAVLQAVRTDLAFERQFWAKNLALYPSNDHNARFLVSFRQQEG
jgi:hypothetical protein